MLLPALAAQGKAQADHKRANLVELHWRLETSGQLKLSRESHNQKECAGHGGMAISQLTRTTDF